MVVKYSIIYNTICDICATVQPKVLSVDVSKVRVIRAEFLCFACIQALTKIAHNEGL